MMWTSGLESMVLTRVEYQVTKKYREWYIAQHGEEPTNVITFTSEDQNDTPPEFPTIFLHEIESPPYYDLQHNMEIGIRHYIEIQVFCKTRTECKAIADICREVVTEMGYSTKGGRIANNTNYSISICRYHMTIGGNDYFL